MSSSGGGGATGIFPPIGGYQPGQTVQPPRGYAPAPGPGRARRPPPPPPPRSRFINYPRSGRNGWTRWIPSWKLISAIILTGIIFIIILIGFAYATTPLPPEDQSAKAETTTIYYANGKDVIAKLATQNRETVKLAAIPLPVRQAVLAAEDHTFYSNSGVDPTSIARAAWSNVRGNSLQGGSTISQQYVKNVYDERDRSFKRKFKEVFLAVKVNRSFDKDEILERYLNTIYLGRGAYGLQAASHAYFGPGTDVNKLTVSQGAFLAGVINAPSLADPRAGALSRARAERRWNVVLDAMVKENWLDPATRAKQKFPKTVVQAKPVSLKGQNGYLKQMAEDEVMAKTHLTADQIETGGYKIVTTFDKSLVDAGAKAVKDALPSKQPKGLRVGMASVDPKTGAVKAIYGGPDFLKAQLNQATQDRAQAGSTFKPFALIAALEDGVSLKDSYSSASPMRIDGKKVKNFGGERFGYINLIKATEESVNTVYVQLNKDIGPPKTQAAAYAAGIPKTGANVQGNLVNVLGSADPHPIDMAGAYATFANKGVRREAYSVTSVTVASTGTPVWRNPLTTAKGKRVFAEDSVADLTYAMQQVVQHGTGWYARKLGRPIAGKTGTSSDSKSAWFVGFTPQLSTAVAMHQVGKDGKEVVNLTGFGGVGNITGGTFPIRIWTEYMDAALNGKPILEFPEPVYGGEVTNLPPQTVAPKPKPTSGPNPTLTGNPNPTGTSNPNPSDTGNPGPTRTRHPPITPSVLAKSP